MLEKPKFIQGVFTFDGQGLDAPVLLGSSATYKVAADRRAQFIYFRAGNTADELVYIDMKRAGKTMRLFTLGAKSGCHVPLVVVEDLEPETLLEVYIGAPAGLKGTIILDIGLVEI